MHSLNLPPHTHARTHTHTHLPPQGFFRLKRGEGNGKGLCNIATAASFPIKTSPNHPVPEVGRREVLLYCHLMYCIVIVI